MATNTFAQHRRLKKPCGNCPWFDEAVHQWRLVLQVKGHVARHAVVDLPKALFPSPGRLRSIGWHLEQPVLWVD